MVARVQRRVHTYTSTTKAKSAHFEMAKAHPIQHGARLTDGPSVLRAEGADLISKQVKPKRGRGRDTPVSAWRWVLPAPPPQLGGTSSPLPPLTVSIRTCCQAGMLPVYSSSSKPPHQH